MRRTGLRRKRGRQMNSGNVNGCRHSGHGGVYFDILAAEAGQIPPSRSVEDRGILFPLFSAYRWLSRSVEGRDTAYAPP